MLPTEWNRSGPPRTWRLLTLIGRDQMKDLLPRARKRSGSHQLGQGVKRRRVAASISALALIAAGLLTATPAQAAPGDAFPVGDPLVFVGQGNPTGLFQATTDSSGTVSFAPEGPPSNLTYNGLAYNTADNYLYAFVNTGNAAIPTGSLIRIGQEGTISRVGTSTYPATIAASFGPNGNYYMTSGANLVAINVATGAIVSTTPVSGSGVTGNDFAYRNNFFWSAGNGSISRLNPVSGVRVEFAVPFVPTTDQAGAAWTFGNSNIGFSYNVSGTVQQVAITNPASASPTFTLVASSSGPASSNNDGAASPGQPTDLAIVKTGPTALVPGTTATYTLAVTNNGPGNSSGFVVNDVVPAALTNVASPDEACTVTGNAVQCIGGRLEAGASASFTVTATVPAGVTSAVDNTATVTSNETDPTPGNNTSTTTAGPAEISILKNAGTPVDVNENGIVDEGDTIQYTFDVTNTGLVPLTAISVDDPKVGAVICPQPTLASGASQTCAAEAPYVITEADVDLGSVDNSATATGNTADGDPVTSTPSMTSTPTTAAAPAITVVKSATPSEAASYEAGQVVTYRFAVTNTGNVPLNDVTVVEGDFTGTGDLSDVLCPADSLAVGAQFVCTAMYTLTQADVDAGELTNSATVEGTPPGSSTPTPSTPSTVTIPNVADPSLTVVKSASAEAITSAGQVITYSFLVTNTGNVTLDEIAVTETEFSGSGELSTVVCPTDALVPGQFTTCTATYTVTQADVDAGELTNAAAVEGTTPGGDPVPSDPSTVTVPVDQTPALTVVKSSDVVAAAVGQEITYSFLVTNTGNVTITDPSVNEVEFSGTGELSDIGCPAGDTLAPGEDITCTATYVVTQADVNAGAITNTATVTGTTPGGDPTDPSDPSENVVTTNPLPAIAVVKSADVKQVTAAGQTVTYTFVVSNVGNVTLTNPTVNEGAFSGNGELSDVVCPTGALEPGEDITCTATYRVVAADLADGGMLTNTATASATTPGGDPITSTPSTARVTEVPPSPAAGGLAVTGGTVAWTAAGIALMLIVAGGTVIIARRRAQITDEA